MNRKRSLLVVAAGALFVGSFLGCGGGGQPFAVIKTPAGKVDVRVKAGGAFAVAQDGTSIQRGGAIRTGEKSTSDLQFTDGSKVQVRPESYLELNDGDPAMKQDSGAVIYKVAPQKETLRIQTPHGVTAVLGTTFVIEVSSQATSVALEEGKIAFTSAASGEKRELSPGQRLVAPGVGTLPPTIQLSPIERQELFKPGESGSVGINRR